MKKSYLFIAIALIGAIAYFAGSGDNKNETKSAGVVIDGVRYGQVEGNTEIDVSRSQNPDMVGKIVSISGSEFVIEKYSQNFGSGEGRGDGSGRGQEISLEVQNMNEEERQVFMEERRAERAKIEREVIGKETILVSSETKISMRGQKGEDAKNINVGDLKTGNQVSIWLAEGLSGTASSVVVNSL